MRNEFDKISLDRLKATAERELLVWIKLPVKQGYFAYTAISPDWPLHLVSLFDGSLCLHKAEESNFLLLS